MGLVQEFRAFALRGNVIDLAVAVIVGTAFGRITTSLVNDVLMPPLGLLLGGVDFGELFVTLGPGEFATLADARAAGAPTIAYGQFLNTLVHFVLIAAAMFAVVKQMNWIKRLNESPEDPMALPDTRNCPECTSVIALAARRCPYCTSPVQPAE